MAIPSSEFAQFAASVQSFIMNTGVQMQQHNMGCKVQHCHLKWR